MEEFDLKGFVSRLREGLKTADLTAAEAGRKAGLSNDAIRNIFNGKSASPRIKTILSLSNILNMDPVYLISGRNQMVSDTQFAMVKRLDIKASAGLGNYIDTETLIDRFAFNRNWLKREGLHSDQLSIVTVDGDSMEPILKIGDLVLVNHAEKEIITGKIYVFRVEDELFIKTLQKLPNRRILVSSENKRYESYQISSEDFTGREENFEIIGRVITSMNKY